VALALAGAARADGGERPRWCAPEYEVLSGEVCLATPERPSEPKTLVLFLHSLVSRDTTWQWEQQRTIARAAKSRGMVALMPRGRLGLGPGAASDVWAWPTAQRTERAVEAELVGEWTRARAQAEERFGRFERVFVFGFSSGAYYAASLALRNRIGADGFGIIAGGSGSKWKAIEARSVEHRAPVFIGYGTKDPARADPRALARLLQGLNWPHRLDSARVGHTVTNAQLDRAFEYLTKPAGKSRRQDAKPRATGKL
jgi:predicted esterase